MKKFLFATLVALAAFATACGPEDGPKGGSGVTADLKADAAFVDGKANVQVVLSAAAEAEVKATLAIASDSQLKDVTVEPSTVVIPAGQTTGKAVLTLASGLEPGEYTVKLGMTVTGAKAGTDVVTVKAVVEGPEEELPIVLNVANPELSANAWLKEQSTGAVYSFEVKFMSTEWNHFGGNVYCNRFCNFEEIDESKGIMLRFSNGDNHDGELHLTASSLLGNEPWVRKDNKAYVWETNTWHTASFVVDGTNMSVYDNGVFLSSYPIKNNADGWTFERFELGMTWDDGSNWSSLQLFKGYLAYARFWKKALTAEEIKAGLCHVDHNAEGLASAWEFNQDGGALIPDITGGGNDMDWSKVFMMSTAKLVDKSDIIRSQWYDWDEDEMGPLCPDFSAAE